VPVVDFFSQSAPERFRAHALAVQRAAEHLASLVGYPNRDELAVSALLHDVGKLVLAAAYPDEVDAFRADLAAPDARVKAEREALGVDHAMVGGVLVRRWGLPDRLAATVERHHAPGADGEAAIVRLADMLAHYAHGRPVDPSALLAAARAIGLAPTELRSVLYELPGGGAMRRGVEPSPLTPKEQSALRGLADGKLYKEIAINLGVTTSTIRSHLHSSYKKLGAADRAQAVLIATERGWL
jgi:putative nucleotidyltransferase with HDIG domain